MIENSKNPDGVIREIMKEHGKVTNYLMELQAYPKETMKIVR